MLLGGDLQIDAKNSNLDIFEHTLYLKSRSMPLSCLLVVHDCWWEKNTHYFFIGNIYFKLNSFSIPLTDNDGSQLSAFYCARDNIYLECQTSAVIHIDFLPFHTGKNQCSVLFINEKIGEFLYSIEALSTLPVPSKLPYVPSKHSVRISSAAAAGECLSNSFSDWLISWYSHWSHQLTQFFDKFLPDFFGDAIFLL